MIVDRLFGMVGDLTPEQEADMRRYYDVIGGWIKETAMQMYWRMLEGGKIEPCTKDEWGDFLESGKQQVKYDKFGEVEVSTIFLGLRTSSDVQYGIPARMFETMVFGGDYDREQERWDTYDEALKGHEMTCKLVQGQKKPQV